MWKRVETAGGLSEALDSGQWDVVLSDFNMPSFDGRAAFELLKEKRKNIPFIVISGILVEEMAVDILKAGADDYIKKGNWSRLIPAIERGMRDAQSRREKMLARRAQEEAEIRYRSLFENAVEGIFRSTPQGRFVSANPALASILGYDSPLELMGEITDIANRLYVEPAGREELFREIRTRGTVSGFETQHYRKDGTRIWVSIHARAVLDEKGELEFIEGMLMNITRRKEAEEALRLAEEKYRSIFENAVEGIFQTTLDGRFLSANPAIARMLGFGTPRELMESIRDVGKQIYAVPERRDEFLRLIMEEKKVSDFEIEYRSKDGSVYWGSVNARPAFDESGNLLYIEGAFQDIMPRKTAEEEKMRLEEQLRHSQKMEAVGTLAGGIAHDFNNLLQAISGNVEILLMKKDQNAPEYTYLADIYSAARRAADLVNHLLTFSRKTGVRFQSMDLNSVIENTLKLLKRTIPRTVSIEPRLSPDLYDVHADPIQMEQILMNLVNNSYAAMPFGGNLTIETENLTLRGSDRSKYLELEPGQYVLLRVTDTGVGMDESTLSHIFEPFFTTKGVGRGTGLGLSTVYGIVKGHGGQVSCSSQPGRGAIFEICLPAHPSVDSAGQEPCAIQAEVRGGNETILVVDDERFLLDLCQEALGSYGYNVLLSESGEEALTVYNREKERIDLIILDLGMPGMGGERCLQELWSLNPSAKVIVASGYAANMLTDVPIGAGKLAFLSKPYRLDDMLGRVRDMLDGC